MTQQDPEAERARRLVHGQVCYLQMPAADSDRAAAFYEAVFGWQTEHPYLDFISPGLIGQWVAGRPPAPPALWPRSWIPRATLSAWPPTPRPGNQAWLDSAPGGTPPGKQPSQFVVAL